VSDGWNPVCDFGCTKIIGQTAAEAEVDYDDDDFNFEDL
jgi:hypothetical protein